MIFLLKFENTPTQVTDNGCSLHQFHDFSLFSEDHLCQRSGPFWQIFQVLLHLWCVMNLTWSLKHRITNSIRPFLLRRAIFLWLSTRLCMREVRASQKTWKPTTTSFGRGWLSYWPSASQTSICWRLRPTWTASMTFSPQLFWRAHPTIRFISGAYFSKTFTTQLKIIQILLWEQCVISQDHDDLLMILFEPRLDEVRRLENFLDGCQNRVGWHFLCSFTFSLIFDIFVLQWHFRWSLQFSLIVFCFHWKNCTGICIKPYFRALSCLNFQRQSIPETFVWPICWPRGWIQSEQIRRRNNICQQIQIANWRDFGCVVGLAYVGTLCRKSANTAWTKVFFCFTSSSLPFDQHGHLFH